MVEVVAALIFENDSFLICRRPPHKARGGLWEFVGGKVDPDETGKEALARECREELAVEVAAGSVYMEVTHEYPDIAVHLTLYNAKIVSGRPQLLEHTELAWISVADIPKYDFCPADTAILEKLLSGLLPQLQE